VTSNVAVIGGPKPSAASTPSAADRQIPDLQHGTPPGHALSNAGGSPPVPAPQEAAAAGGPELADRFGSLWAEMDEAYYPLLSPPGAVQQGSGVVQLTRRLPDEPLHRAWAAHVSYEPDEFRTCHEVPMCPDHIASLQRMTLPSTC